MEPKISPARTLKRLGASCLLAAAFMMSGVSPHLAEAKTAPVPFEGVMLVPPGQAEETAPAPVHGFERGTLVAFGTKAAPGTIIVNTRKNRLYYVLGKGMAVSFPVATAKKGFEWKGTHKVSSKVKWPDWRPPAEMRKRRPELPSFMAGGPKNPLGARAIYLGSSIYRIHGTNEPSSIGKAASSGCIRMLNADVEELYRHVKIGASVIVM